MFYLYKWENLVADSPQESVRNEWLFYYGAFARWRGIWFPCKIVRYNTIGEPATITAVIPNSVYDMGIYPRGEVSAYDCDVIYTVFANGMSIQAYIQKSMYRKNVTDKMLNAALARSLDTVLLFAPKRLVQHVKKAANREDKKEAFVVETNNKDEIGAIELPRTIDIVEKLWNSNDWALQELSQVLGISYNPAHGKKERMLSQELLGDRDLTIMNREKVTSRLIVAATAFGEKVSHISTEVDYSDRNLQYGKIKTESEEKDNDRTNDTV